MKIKDIVGKPKTDKQKVADDLYYEYGHGTYDRRINFDDSLTICSFDKEEMAKNIKKLNSLDED